MTKYIDKNIRTKDGQYLAVRFYDGVKNASRYLVLIPGCGGDNASLTALVPLLQAALPQIGIVTYEMRGHGGSSRCFPSTVESIEEVGASDLQAVLQNLTMPAIVMGHSFAGVIVQEYLNQQFLPVLGGAILVNSQINMPFSGWWPRQWFFRIMQRKSGNWHYSPLTRQWSDHLRYLNSWDYDLRRAYLDAMSMDWRLYLLYFGSIFGWRNLHVERLQRIPTLYIYSSKDQILWPSAQRSALRRLPTVSSKLITTNHNALVNNPTAIADAVQEWVKENKLDAK